MLPPLPAAVLRRKEVVVIVRIPPETRRAPPSVTDAAFEVNLLPEILIFEAVEKIAPPAAPLLLVKDEESTERELSETKTLPPQL
jgi:hypothetical protein